MVDAVASQTLIDGDRSLVIKLTNISDGTGEAAVVKVDASAFGASALRLDKIDYTTAGMGVDLLWEATADVLAWHVGADQEGSLDLTSVGGIANNAGAGKTEDMALTTIGHTSGDRYTLVLHFRKI